MNDTLIQIITSIVTSIIAAFIFWFFVNYLPERSRYNKIRPKLEYDIYEICSSLFHFIEIPLRSNTYSPANNQAKLFAGMLNLDDFELALYTKCLNDSYKFDKVASCLVPIGDELESLSLDICQKAQQLYVFNQYLTVEEILLIRKVTVKLRAYSYNSVAAIEVGNQTLYPINPTMSYMCRNFYDIYLFFVQLQEIVFKYKKIDDTISGSIKRTISARRIMNYCHRGEYEQCLKYAKKSDDNLVWAYKFISLYKTNKEASAVFFLKQQLQTSNLELKYLRDTFYDFYKDEILKNILISCRSMTEYKEMADCIESEQNYSNQMILHAQNIRKYYKEK
ncbi:hypothetical protein [Bacteroides graminisolvens]|uniref:hypothetical protein n=1 Tax=Bacteroides graminisolvens TaxID=477666 RepID=UPI0024098AA3|nr:hypothetical protein [Bacteroides graminisolvens]